MTRTAQSILCASQTSVLAFRNPLKTVLNSQHPLPLKYSGDLCKAPCLAYL